MNKEIEKKINEFNSIIGKIDNLSSSLHSDCSLKLGEVWSDKNADFFNEKVKEVNEMINKMSNKTEDVIKDLLKVSEVIDSE